MIDQFFQYHVFRYTTNLEVRMLAPLGRSRGLYLSVLSYHSWLVLCTQLRGTVDIPARTTESPFAVNFGHKRPWMRIVSRRNNSLGDAWINWNS